MVLSPFEQVMKEHMSYTDLDTVKIIAEASPSNQNQILVALTSKLYEMIVAKVTHVDYSTVNASRGDITKVMNYQQLVETINIIKNIVAEYKCDTKPVDAIVTAMANIENRTPTFKKAFTIGAPVVVTLYNSMVVNIIASVSYMIDTCIEYIKNPQSQTFQMAMDVVAYNKTRDCLMFDTLNTFNEGCASGDVDQAIKVSMQQSRVRREAVEAGEQAMQEGYKFNNPNNFTLRLVQKCVKAIREGKAKHISQGGIESQVANIIDKRLNNVDLGSVMMFSVSYGVASSNLAHTESMLRELRKLTLKSIQEMENDYNATHKIKRTYAQTYSSSEIDLIRKCANQVRKQKVAVSKEAVLADPESSMDLMEFIKECGEEQGELCAQSPFMTDDEINGEGERVVLHDDDPYESYSEAFDGVVSIVGRGLLALCKLVIPMIRHVVYLYFFSRQRISDYFESQAIAIEMNAYQLQYNQEMEPERRQEIYAKQMKVAEKLRRKAQRTSIDYKRAEKDAEKEIQKEQQKYTSTDLDYNPNDENLANTSSVLF